MKRKSLKQIVVTPGKNDRGFDLFSWLVNELEASSINAGVYELPFSETKSNRGLRSSTTKGSA